jgi:hypothetical protein
VRVRHTATVLRANPDIAARVGYFFAEFAILEWELDAAFEAILGPHQAVKELFFRPRDGITQKLQVIRAVIGELAPNSHVSETIAKMKSELEIIISFRNALAHGIYGSSGLEFILTTPDLKKRYPLTAVAMDEWLDRLEHIADQFNFARKRIWRDAANP